MLNLLEPTPSHWVEHAYADLPRLLSDHAHCELKAAQSALSLVGRYAGEAPELVEPLVALAKEETQHFNLVHQRIAALDEPMAMPASDKYVRALRDAAEVLTETLFDGAADRAALAIGLVPFAATVKLTSTSPRLALPRRLRGKRHERRSFPATLPG